MASASRSRRVGHARPRIADEKVKAAIEGKEVVKVLVVKGRLVNIVVC